MTDKASRIGEILTKYRSQVMGIAIIWIMLFHSGIDAPESSVLRVLWYIFISFGGGLGVNLFVIASGLGLMLSSLKKSEPEPIGRFYARRFTRLLPAYLAVALVFYIVKGYGPLKLLDNVIFSSFFRGGVRDFWYIALMIVLYLIFPFIVRLSRKIGVIPTMAIATILNIALDFILHGFFPELYQNIEVLVTRMLCFWLGCIMGWMIYKNDKKITVAVLLSALILTVILLIPAKFNPISCSLRLQRYIFIPLSAVLYVAIVWIMSLMPRFINAFIAYFGTRSLELYLVHVSIGGMIAGLISNTYLSLAVYFAASIFIAEAVYILTNKQSILYKKIKGSKKA